MDDPSPGRKVLSLRGAPIPSGNEPVSEVIDALEKYLEQARNGQIRAIAFAIITADSGVTTGWNCGADADSRMVLSGVAALQYRLAKDLDED